MIPLLLSGYDPSRSPSDEPRPFVRIPKRRPVPGGPRVRRVLSDRVCGGCLREFTPLRDSQESCSIRCAGRVRALGRRTA